MAASLIEARRLIAWASRHSVAGLLSIMTPLFLMSNDRFLLCLVVGVVCVVWYVIAPIAVSLRGRIDIRLTPEVIDGVNYPVPEAVRDRLDQDAGQLMSAGFQPLEAFIVHGYGPTTESLHYCFVNRDNFRVAMVSAVLTVTVQNRSLRFLDTQILCQYHDGQESRELIVSNSNHPGPFFRNERTRFFLVPHVSKISRLLELFDCLERRELASLPRFLTVDTDYAGSAAAWGAAGYSEVLKVMSDLGYLTPVADEPQYRIPLASVYRLFWRQWWPMKFVYRQIHRLHGRQLERGLLSGSSASV